jgi:uncharacterized protein YyaL (SSP411 family)
MPFVQQSPSAHTGYLCALDMSIGPLQDVVIAGERDADDTGILMRALQDPYFPHVLVICRSPGTISDLLNIIAPFTQNMNSIGGKATAYICSGHTCASPTTESQRMLELLQGSKPKK